MTKKLLQASELSLLEQAYEMTEQSNVTASHLADLRERMGDLDEATEVLKAGLEKNPTDTRLRDLWVRFEIEKDHPREALEIAIEGAKADPTSWRMQRHIARLKKSLGHHLESVKGHYEAAIRHNKGNVDLLIELAAYLFINRKYAEANMAFSGANDAAVNHQERSKIYHRWIGQEGKPVIFDGKVKSIQGAAARAVAIPEGFQAFFWRTHPKLTDLKEGDQIKFQVGFSSKGPVAHIVF